MKIYFFASMITPLLVVWLVLFSWRLLSCLLCVCAREDEHLEWMTDGRDLWEGIVDLHPTILTGLPMGHWAEPQKVWALSTSDTCVSCGRHILPDMAKVVYYISS